jgi:hypothetical protein
MDLTMGEENFFKDLCPKNTNNIPPAKCEEYRRVNL